MAPARTTYQDGRGAEGAVPAGRTFVWVSLRDPSPEELASVQHEFALPRPSLLRDGQHRLVPVRARQAWPSMTARPRAHAPSLVLDLRSFPAAGRGREAGFSKRW